MEEIFLSSQNSPDQFGWGRRPICLFHFHNQDPKWH
jgi:hypothetical protein